jgi:hypothetical protein
METNRRSISRNFNILNPHPYGGGGSIFRSHNILNPLLLTMKTQMGVIVSCIPTLKDVWSRGVQYFAAIIFWIRVHYIAAIILWTPGSIYYGGWFNISQRYFEPGFKILRGSKCYMTPGPHGISAYGPIMIWNRKQGHYSDRRIYEMMTLSDIHYNLATSTFL